MQIKNVKVNLKNKKVKVPINFSFEFDFDLNLLNNQKKLLNKMKFFSFKELMENDIKNEMNFNVEKNNNQNNEDNNDIEEIYDDDYEYEQYEFEEEENSNNTVKKINTKEDEMSFKIRVTFVNLLLIIMFYILNKFHL
jgi:hypothetical protein